MQHTLLLLTVCVPGLAIVAGSGFLLAASERRKRWLSDRRRGEANRRRWQAERGFRERGDRLRDADAGLYRLDLRYQQLGRWAVEEGRPIDKLIVEQGEIMRSRLLIDRCLREPTAAAVGSRLKKRWRRDGTGDG